MPNDILIKLSADGTQVRNEIKLIDKELKELGKDPQSPSSVQSRQSSTDSTTQRNQARNQVLLLRELKLLRQEMSNLNNTYAKASNSSSPSGGTGGGSGGSGGTGTPGPSSNNNNNNSGGGSGGSNNRSGGSGSGTSEESKVMQAAMNQIKELNKAVHAMQRATSVLPDYSSAYSLNMGYQRQAYQTYRTVGNFSDYGLAARNAAKTGIPYGYSAQETMGANSAFIQRSGYNAATNQRDLEAVMKGSNGMGLDPNSFATLAGRMISAGTAKQGDIKKIADAIGASVAEHSMQGREDEQRRVFESVFNSLSAKNTTVSSDMMNSGMSIYRGLANANENLRGDRGATLTEKLMNAANSDNKSLKMWAGWGSTFTGAKGEWELDKLLETDKTKAYSMVMENMMKSARNQGYAGEDLDLFVKRAFRQITGVSTSEAEDYLKAYKTGGMVKGEYDQAQGEKLIDQNNKRSQDSAYMKAQRNERQEELARSDVGNVAADAYAMTPESVAYGKGATQAATSPILSAASNTLGYMLPFLGGRFLANASPGSASGGLGGILRSGLGNMGGVTGLAKGVLKGGGILGGVGFGLGAYESAKQGDTFSAVLQGALGGGMAGMAAGPWGALAGAVLGGGAAGIKSLLNQDSESGVAHAATAPQDKTLSSTLLQDESKERNDRSNRMIDANTQAVIDNTNALKGRQTADRVASESPTSAKKSQEDEKDKKVSNILRGIVARGNGNSINLSPSTFTGSMGSGGMIQAASAKKSSGGSGNYNMSGGAVDTSGILDRDITQDSGVTADTLNKLFANGIMKGMGQDFIDIGHEYGIDPAFLAAITKAENNYGSDLSGILGHQGSQHNVMSILDANHLPETYDMGSVQGNVREMAKQLRKYYVEGSKNGYDDRRTARSIQEIYCPDGAEGGGHWRNAIPTAYEDMIRIQGSLPGTSKVKSHAQGLEYVPRDDYPAQLHKGERVLTKHEAEEFRNLPGLVDIPDSMRITGDEGLYGAKAKHQLQKDYKQQSATTSSDPFFGAPRFSQGNKSVGGATSGKPTMVVLDTSQVVDYDKYIKNKDTEYKGTSIMLYRYKDKDGNWTTTDKSGKEVKPMTAAEREKFHQDLHDHTMKYGTEEQKETLKKIDASKEYLQKYMSKNNPTTASVTSTAPVAKDYSSTKEDDEKFKAAHDYFEQQRKEAHKEYKARERAKTSEQRAAEKKQLQEQAMAQAKERMSESYTPTAGTVETVNPDGSVSRVAAAQSPATQQQSVQASRVPDFMASGGGFAGGMANAQQGINPLFSQGRLERQTRQTRFQQYMQKMNKNSMFNPRNNNKLGKAITSMMGLGKNTNPLTSIFSMSAKVRTGQGQQAGLGGLFGGNPENVGKGLGAGILGAGGSLLGSLGGALSGLGGLFGSKKKDGTPEPDDGKNHHGLVGLLQKWGNTATDKAQSLQDSIGKDTLVAGASATKDGKTELEKLASGDNKHHGLLGRWRNTAEERGGGLNKLFAAGVDAVEGVGQGLGGLFGGLFGSKKKKMDKADPTEGLGSSPIPDANVATGKGLGGDNGGGSQKVEIGAPESITVRVIDDKDKELAIANAPLTTKVIGEMHNNFGKNGMAFLNAGGSGKSAFF